MKSVRIVKCISQGFIFLSGLSLLSVSMMAFADPQSVMDLVAVRLDTTDAFSSIRGIYGGAGLALFVSLMYLMRREVQKGLAFLGLLWGLYAISRIMTIWMEGALGDFGTQWLVIESVLCISAILLLLASRSTSASGSGTSIV